jgi:hypothetical protein
MTGGDPGKTSDFLAYKQRDGVFVTWKEARPDSIRQMDSRSQTSIRV